MDLRNIRAHVQYVGVDGNFSGPSMNTTIPGPKTKVHERIKPR